MKAFFRSFPLLLILILLQGCIDKDMTNIDENVVYKPEYSFPIGPVRYDILEVMDTLLLDSSLVGGITEEQRDSVFSFNDTYFRLPIEGIQEHSIIFESDFSSLFQSIEQGQIRSLMFRINYENQTPGELLLQVNFLDESQAAFHSLFSDGALEMIPRSSGRRDIPLTQDEIELLVNTRYIEFWYAIKLDGEGEIIQFTDQDYIYSHLAMRLALEIPFGDV